MCEQAETVAVKLPEYESANLRFLKGGKGSGGGGGKRSDGIGKRGSANDD